jgi:hypothetical protein
MSWVIGSAEFMAGVACLALGLLIIWISGKGGPTRTRIITLPIIVLLLIVAGVSTMLHTFGKL